MGNKTLSAVIRRVKASLAAHVLSSDVEEAIELLLNAVEALNAQNHSLADEVQRLRKQLEQKKREKNSRKGEGDPPPKPDGNHSSEEHRKQLAKLEKPPRTGLDHRTFKPLVIHEDRECGLPQVSSRCTTQIFLNKIYEPGPKVFQAAARS